MVFQYTICVMAVFEVSYSANVAVNVWGVLVATIALSVFAVGIMWYAYRTIQKYSSELTDVGTEKHRLKVSESERCVMRAVKPSATTTTTTTTTTTDLEKKYKTHHHHHNNNNPSSPPSPSHTHKQINETQRFHYATS